MNDAEQLLVLSRARAAWDAAKRDDDENMREASELRLARAWPRPRVAPARVFALGMAAAFAVAALLFFVLRPRAQSAAIGVAAAPATTTPIAAPSAPPAIPAPRPRKLARVVATNACRECKLEPGAPIDERVQVPAGARVTLGFAFDDGLVDPAFGADLVGPATASAGPEATLTIERGVVRVRAPRDLVILVPGGKVSASNAVYTVRVDDHGVSRIDVEKGRVAYAKGSAAELVLPVGGTAFEAARAPATAATTTPVPAPEPAAVKPQEEVLADARVRARQGDATGRAELEKLASSSDARVARRASFTLAELDLASGQKDKARARLDELLMCPEGALAADAATLLARSHGSAAERAEVWRRFLGTYPASPYFERAQLERADALLDAGRTAEAKKILDEVRASSRLNEAQQKQLDRLVVKAR